VVLREKCVPFVSALVPFKLYLKKTVLLKKNSTVKDGFSGIQTLALPEISPRLSEPVKIKIVQYKR
jgi:hypothetical protein